MASLAQCAAIMQPFSGRGAQPQRHPCLLHGRLRSEDEPSSSGRGGAANGRRPASRRAPLRPGAYLQSSEEPLASGGSVDIPSSNGPALVPSEAAASIAAAAGAAAAPRAGALALVQEQGGASLLQLVAAWDQLAARLPPQAGAGRGAEVILEALKVAVSYAPAAPSLQTAAVLAQQQQQQQLGGAQLSRAVERALSLASRLADLAASGVPIDAESIAAGILAEVLLAGPGHSVPGAWHPAASASASGGSSPGSGGLTLQVIEERVGPIVAQLVHDIQRARQLPARVELLDDTAASALRELCLAFYDVRATAVEIVARLDLLCSPGQPSYEQQVAALEALQMYAPMGHALGLGPVAQQLEDRCFQILFPESYVRTAAWLREEAASSADTLARCQAALHAAVLAQPRFSELAGGLAVHGRTKTLFSTLKKLLRLGNTAAGGRARAQLYDLMGLRAIVQPRADLPPEEAEELAAQACYLVRDAACSLWDCLPERAKDYIAAPKSNGYRSLHSTVRVQCETASLDLQGDSGASSSSNSRGGAAGEEEEEQQQGAVRSSTATLELQIRTQAMHDCAERGEAAHGAYKGGLDAAQAMQLKAVTDSVLRRAAAAAAAAAAAPAAASAAAEGPSGSAASSSGGMSSADAAADSLFRHLDQNGDGRISLEELQFALQELGVHEAQAQSRAAAELLQLASADSGGSRDGGGDGAGDDGTIGFEAFMAFQRRVGLLQAISAVDHQQAHLLEEQHSAAATEAQAEEAAGAAASPDGSFASSSISSSFASSSISSSFASSSSSSMDEGSFFSDPLSAAGLASWTSGSFDGADGGAASSSSSRLTAGAVGCRAHAAAGLGGTLGWQPPARLHGRRRSMLFVRATIETASSSSSSADSDIDHAHDAAGVASSSSSGGGLHGAAATATASRVGGAVRNGVVALQERQRFGGDTPSSSSNGSSNGTSHGSMASSSNGANGYGNGAGHGSHAAGASSPHSQARAGHDELGQEDGALLQKPERRAPPPRGTFSAEEESAVAAAADADATSAAAQLWQASRAVQGIVRLVSREGPPPADATWQLVPAPSNPHPVLNAAGDPLPAAPADGEHQQQQQRVQAVRVPEQGPCIIGAVLDRDCDFVLDVPTVSGRHCRLEVVRRPDARGGYSKLLITDLGSTNGTRVNRRRIEPFKEMPLRAGDTVSLAEPHITFEVQVLPPPRPARAAVAASNGTHATAASASGAGAAAAAAVAATDAAAAAQQAAAAAPAVVAALRIAGALEALSATQGLFPPGGAVYADLPHRARQLMQAGSYEQAYVLLLAGAMQQPWEGGLWAQLANLERQRARRRERKGSSSSSGGAGSPSGGSYGAARAFFAAAAACFAAVTTAGAGGSLRAAGERAEGLARVLSSWAQLELAQGHGSAARTLFRRGVAAAREHPAGGAAAGAPRVLVTWAALEWKAGQATEAQRLCVEALEMESGNAYALTLLGSMEAAAGQLDVARRLYGRALEARPNHTAALHAWARLEAASGSMRAARGLFRRALDLEPGSAYVLQAWGVAEARRGGRRQAGQARLLLQRATAADPACRAAWHAWGKLEDEAGNVEEARRLYQQVLLLEAGSVPALSALGCLERRCGDLAAAERHLAAALAADPSHLPSLHELAAVREAQGKRGEGAVLRRRAERLASSREAAMKEVAAARLPLPRPEQKSARPTN